MDRPRHWGPDGWANGSSGKEGTNTLYRVNMVEEFENGKISEIYFRYDHLLSFPTNLVVQKLAKLHDHMSEFGMTKVTVHMNGIGNAPG